MWCDRLKDLQSLYSVRLDKQWSPYYQTQPHQHVTETSRVWLSQRMTGENIEERQQM